MDNKELFKINACRYLFTQTASGKEVLEKISNLVVKNKVETKVSDLLDEFPTNLKAFIIDLEGKPPFLVGFQIHDKNFQFYITNMRYINQLIYCILNILNILKENKYVGFSFSNYEEIEMKRFYIKCFTEREKLDHLEILKNYELINLQQNLFESVLEALYTLNVKFSNDILFKDHSLIQKYFEMKNIDIILKHNIHCLNTERFLLFKRFLKRYKI